MYKVGETVYINHPDEPYYMEPGEVIGIDKHSPYTYHVQMADGDFWFNEHELVSGDGSNASDFDGGFGIGGLERHTETPTIPSAKTLESYERKLANATVCQRCGCSDVFDGAMFTTNPSSGCCDDCLDS